MGFPDRRLLSGHGASGAVASMPAPVLLTLARPARPDGGSIIADAVPTPEPPADPPLTQLLRRAAAGESDAADVAMPLVYRELRRLAQVRMAGERSDHTLQATALVHEAWLRLVGMRSADWADRTAFYHAAAAAMRRVLVDHARRRGRQKRGNGVARDPVSVDSLPALQPDLGEATTFLQLDQEIGKLERDDPRTGAVVRLRFFGGLDVDETADALGLSRRTVLRDWAF
ncbi:MAG TPA: ECF-type sigma factor, partial [Planctomycetota bacterium]|nr:ECF-type sigma factor [Planctomycetota bacterium]